MSENSEEKASQGMVPQKIKKPKPDYDITGYETIKFFLVAGLASFATAGGAFLLQPYLGRNDSLLATLLGSILGLIFIGFAGGLWWTDHYWKPLELRRLARTVPWGGGEVVLDLGSGLGQFTNIVANKVTTGVVIAIDLWFEKDRASGRVAMLKNNLAIEGNSSKVEVMSVDPQYLPFSEKTFDTVVSGPGATLLSATEFVDETIQSVIESMKEGGRIGILVAGQNRAFARNLRERGMVDVRSSYFRLGVLFPTSSVTARKPFSNSG